MLMTSSAGTRPPEDTNHTAPNSRSRSTRQRKASRWVAAAAGGAALLIATQTWTPAPASAAPTLSGLQRYSASTPLYTSQAVQTAMALCPPGKVVVGGGGRVVDPSRTHRLALIQLEPSSYLQTTSGTRNGYLVTAAETVPGVSTTWHVEAWAMCANPVRGRVIYQADTLRSSRAVQAAKVGCPAGQVVLGSGARVNNPIGPTGQQVSLQVARPSQPGDIARAQAHEDPDGFSGEWSVSASAICAPRPTGYQVVFEPSADAPTAVIKTATPTCPTGRRVISAGAATSDVAPGNVALTEVNPLDRQLVLVRATEIVPTNQDWDFIVGSAVCATTS